MHTAATSRHIFSNYLSALKMSFSVFSRGNMACLLYFLCLHLPKRFWIKIVSESLCVKEDRNESSKQHLRILTCWLFLFFRWWSLLFVGAASSVQSLPSTPHAWPVLLQLPPGQYQQTSVLPKLLVGNRQLLMSYKINFSFCHSLHLCRYLQKNK